jgi:hypothetical protein
MVDRFEHDAPWPIRKDTARILQASEFSIDSARNTAILRGDVTEEYRFRQATGMKTIKRAAVVRERYYIPCSELLAVVRALRRRDVQLSKD